MNCFHWLFAILLATGAADSGWIPGVMARVAEAQVPVPGVPPQFDTPDNHLEPLSLSAQLVHIRHALVALPLAAALGAALAFRMRRRGTPPRNPAVIQTQIILAVVGAIVMLVIGESVARAFGIVGAAGLVRYRAKIGDPKDAGVMLSTLAIGLASGVGHYVLAVFGAAFIWVVLWLIESFEPVAYKSFDLKVAAKQPNELRNPLEAILRRNRVIYELRSSTNDELVYDVQLPFEKRTDGISNAIFKLSAGEPTAVEWDQKKKK